MNISSVIIIPHPDRIAAVAALPLAERFANCPWALYHIGVEAG